jgi:hypothetical protein
MELLGFQKDNINDNINVREIRRLTQIGNKSRQAGKIGYKTQKEDKHTKK